MCCKSFALAPAIISDISNIVVFCICDRAATIRKARTTASKGATNRNLQSASYNAGDLAASMSAMDLASASVLGRTLFGNQGKENQVNAQPPPASDAAKEILRLVLDEASEASHIEDFKRDLNTITLPVLNAMLDILVGTGRKDQGEDAIRNKLRKWIDYVPKRHRWHSLKTIPQLKKELQKRGIQDLNGNKNDLIERLLRPPVARAQFRS